MFSLTAHLRVPATSVEQIFRKSTLCVLFLLALGVIPTVSRAHTTPGSALQAQEMLGEGVWSRVVKLTHDNAKSRYPETLYATVFEFDNVLWFYTSTGTQPIERSRNRVDQYRGDLLPLLRTLERKFNGLTFLAPSQELAENPTEIPSLKNGCVIESIYTMEKLRTQGENLKRANLLLYSTTRNSRRGVSGNSVGHAVLVYETDEGFFVVDPPEIHVVRPLTETEGWEPEVLAATIESPYGKTKIQDAFLVPVYRTEVTTGTAFASGEGR